MPRRVLLTVLLLPLGLRAAQDPWLRMRTANFELFTDAGERTGRKVLEQFERVHSFFELAYKNQKANAKPVCLIVFRSVQDYRQYSPNQAAAAYFQPGGERDFIVMTAEVTDSPRVPVHEYTHLMIHQSDQRIPLWLNEGTAELFSTMEARGPRVLVGNVIPSHLAALAGGRWIDLNTLLATDRSSPLYNEKNRASIFYAESWLLVHMLNLDASYRPHFSEFVAALQENGAAEAFQQAYGKPLTEVEDDLYEYFQRKRVNGLLFPVQLSKSADAPEVQPDARFGIRLALARLLSDMPGKRNPAHTAYAELERDYPGQWEVEAGLAQWYWRERDGAEAARRYARALAMGCKDQRAYIEYGRILLSTRREKEAAAALRSAVALDPANQQAHYELAIALTGSGEYQAALAEFKDLDHIARQEASRYCYYYAYALYRDGQLQRARAILERGRPLAATEQERNDYAGLSTALDLRTSGAPPAPPDQKVGEPPQLVHRNMAAMEGQLTRFDCNGTQAALHLNVNGAEEIFLIDDPRKVTIRGVAAEGPARFPCGPQKNQQLLVQYEESRDDAGKVTRLARILEFR
jgi:tetratricopeptide (TPR) repeat protein